MKNLIIISTLIFVFSNTIFAQCPSYAASLGQGNGLQLCWPRNEAPAELDSIIYDGVVYAGRFVNGGQGDCWRTTTAATLGVNGNHILEVVIDGLPESTCSVENGTVLNSLPVTLAYFSATVEEQAVLIEWQTMEEENNDYFLVERSVDAVNFETIAKVEGAGTINDVQFYEIQDEAVMYQAGNYYYRLKQVDFDGSFTYSDIQAIEINQSVEVEIAHVFPNPASENINILLNISIDAQTQITILDMTGRTVAEKTIENTGSGVQNIEMNISTFQKGCYMLRVQSGQSSKTTQFIKI